MNRNNFIIFFNEKQGTSPTVQLLSNFEQISVIKLAGRGKWEPFDTHNCGRMPLKDLKTCLKLIYDDQPVDLPTLNKIYTKTGVLPIANFNKEKAVGFKMRFSPPKWGIPWLERSPFKQMSFIDKRYRKLWGTQYSEFRNFMIEFLKEYDIAVFFAVRKDLFRWALSIYHGDGSGAEGHMQFKIAAGKLKKEDIPKIKIDCNRFEEILNKYSEFVQEKWKLYQHLLKEGVRTTPLVYEEFCADRERFFKKIFEHLRVPVTDEDIQKALAKGTIFEKVHSENISDFVINHEEVLARYGERKSPWPGL